MMARFSIHASRGLDELAEVGQGLCCGIMVSLQKIGKDSSRNIIFKCNFCINEIPTVIPSCNRYDLIIVSYQCIKQSFYLQFSCKTAFQVFIGNNYKLLASCFLVHFWKSNFKQQWVCKFDIAKNVHFPSLLILFIYIYLHTTWHLVIW